MSVRRGRLAAAVLTAVAATVLSGFAVADAQASPKAPAPHARLASRAAVAPQASGSGALRPGFSSYTLAGNDDGSTNSVSLPFAITFYGHTYSSLFINNNGNFTFNGPLGEFTPRSLNQLGQPMIAPFWADVDTRVGNLMRYGYGTVNGHSAFGATWSGVGCFAQIDSVTDYFQVILINRSDAGYGKFDIEFNYGPMAWDAGQASGSDSRCRNGTSARAGYTSGFGSSYELPGSGVNGALLGTGQSTSLANHSSGSSQAGRYVFAVRGGGQPPTPKMVALGDSYSAGVGTKNDDLAGSPCHRSSGGWPYLMSREYHAAPQLTPSGYFACSGDTTVQVLGGKPGEQPSQIQQLRTFVAANGAPSLITMTVGGDDLGFAKLLAGCYAYWAGECVNDLNRKIDYLNGGDFTRILARTYQAIKAAAGGANEIAIVGYPFIMPSAGFFSDLHANEHCPWMNGDAAQILARFRQGQQLMDSAMATAASQAGVRFVNIDGALSGHELCTGDSWIQDLSLHNKNLGVAGHPNPTGQQHEADAVAAGLGLLSGAGGGGGGGGFATTAGSSKAARAAKSPAATILPSNPAAGSPDTSGVFSIDDSLDGGAATVPYDGYLWTTGGTAPVTWALTGGALPAGLTLDPSTGLIDGTPTAAGTSTFTVTATDSSSPAQVATANLSMTIGAAPSVSLGGNALPAGTVGRTYSASAPASGGTAPYTWSISSGTLPAGLTLDTSTGAITGTPTSAGSRTFTASVTDSGLPATNDAHQFTVTVAASGSALHVSGGTRPGGTQGIGYESDLSATGGTGALLWSLVGGALPDGLSLDAGTGAITGIPTGSGTSTATVQVLDDANLSSTATASITITITASADPSITTSSLDDATVGGDYLATLTATDGVAPYSWSITTGSLPNGLVLDPSGVISGAPTTSGTFTFTAELDDSSTPGARSATANFTINVADVPPSPMTVSDTVAPGVLRTPYAALLMPDGGLSPYSYALTAGQLPPGLSLDDNGNISGLPTATGTYNATITVSDSAAGNATDDVSIVISAPTSLAITTASLADAAVNTPYGAQIDVTGGVGLDTFAIADGALPDGLSLGPASGVISGTPTSTGQSSFTVTVSDGNATVVAAALSVTVGTALPLVVDQSASPDGLQGVFYTQPLAASGGAEPYSWSVTGGSLPGGLSLDSNTGVLSGTPTSNGTSTFTVEAADQSSQTASATMSILIRAAAQLEITTTALDSGLQGHAYSATLGASGGTPSVSWALTGGTLPDGMELTSSGVLDGTPSSFGTFPFAVTASDSSTPSAQSASQNLSLTITPAIPPVVTTISPTSGPSTGHTEVTINGSGFSSTTDVRFGSVSALNFDIVSDNQMVAIAPPQPIATQDVGVINPAGTSPVVATDKFTYVKPPKPVVTQVDPTSGTTGGGDEIQVFGSGFWGTTKVAFGSTVASNYQVVADDEIDVTTPPHAAGIQNVVVTTPGGASATSTHDRYTYIKPPAPKVTEVDPTSGSGAGGYDVTIVGSNFQQASKVLIGTVAAKTFYVDDPSYIDFIMPPHSAGKVDITVTTPGGTSAKTAADKFTLIAPPKPVVTQLSPTSGLGTGGTYVALFGTALTGVTKVTFGGTAVKTMYPVSDSEIDVLTPKHAAGVVSVAVTTPGGTTVASATPKYTYKAAPKPAITGLSPSTGQPAGRTLVTISGVAFDGATKVTFGGVLAPDFTVVSANEIDVSSPKHSAGTVTVAVTTPAGVSAAVAADRFVYSTTAPSLRPR